MAGENKRGNGGNVRLKSPWRTWLGIVCFFLGSVVFFVLELSHALTHLQWKVARSSLQKSSHAACLLSGVSNSSSATLVHISSALNTTLEVGVPPSDPILEGMLKKSFEETHANNTTNTTPGGVLLRLDRRVQIYQWVERRHAEKRPLSIKTPNNETYRLMTKYHYVPKWVDQPISDVAFKYPMGHRNKGELYVPTKTFFGQRVWMQADLPSPSLCPQESETSRLEDPPITGDDTKHTPIELDSELVQKLAAQQDKGERLELLPDDLDLQRWLESGWGQGGALVGSPPSDAFVRGNALFLRFDQNSDKVHEKPVTKTNQREKLLYEIDGAPRIVESTIIVDGAETIMYQLVASHHEQGGTFFSTRSKAQEALLAAYIRESTVHIDGMERILYHVGPKEFTSRKDALEAAAAAVAASERKDKDANTESNRIQTTPQNTPKSTSKHPSTAPKRRDLPEESMPRIGDLRIHYTKATVVHGVTIVARLERTQLEQATLNEGSKRDASFRASPWTVGGKRKHSFSVGLIQEGRHHTIEDMFTFAEREHQMERWISRLALWIVLLMAISLYTHQQIAPDSSTDGRNLSKLLNCLVVDVGPWPTRILFVTYWCIILVGLAWLKGNIILALACFATAIIVTLSLKTFYRNYTFRSKQKVSKQKKE